MNFYVLEALLNFKYPRGHVLKNLNRYGVKCSHGIHHISSLGALFTVSSLSIRRTHIRLSRGLLSLSTIPMSHFPHEPSPVLHSQPGHRTLMQPHRLSNDGDLIANLTEFIPYSNSLQHHPPQLCSSFLHQMSRLHWVPLGSHHLFPCLH